MSLTEQHLDSGTRSDTAAHCVSKYTALITDVWLSGNNVAIVPRFGVKPVFYDSSCQMCGWQHLQYLQMLQVTFLSCFILVKQLGGCCILPLALSRTHLPSITAGSQSRSLGSGGGENAPHAGCLTTAWPRLSVLCSPLRYILVQFYQRFSPSFQSCWKQHFEWEDEVCPFSCVLSLTTLAPLCLPTYTPHLIQIENLSEGKKHTARAFSRVSSVINHLPSSG